MEDRRCSDCGVLMPGTELLVAEDGSGEFCPECSGLLAGEDLSCRYDEFG